MSNIEELLIQEDKAAARLTLSGTHEGPWAGADPTGKHVSMALKQSSSLTKRIKQAGLHLSVDVRVLRPAAYLP